MHRTLAAIVCLILVGVCTHTRAQDGYFPNAVYALAEDGIFPDSEAGKRGVSLSTSPKISEFLTSFGAVSVKQVFPDFNPADTIMKNRDGTPVRLINLAQYYRIEFSDSVWWEDLQQAYKGDSSFLIVGQALYFVADQVVPNDPLFSSQNHFAYSWSGGGHPMIPLAWEYTTGSPTVKIGVIDNGFDLGHEDLESRIAETYRASSGGSDAGPVLPDEDHGTHVAGITGAATSNGIGGAGVNWNSPLYLARGAEYFNILGIWDGVAFRDDHAAQCIDWLRGRNADVLNMSFGYTDNLWSEAFKSIFFGNAMAAAAYNAWASGTLLVAAKGNDASTNVHRPSDYHTVMGIGSCDYYGERSSFSNYGGELDVTTMGESIYSTVLNDAYGTMSGTSMAAPIATGVASLLKSYRSDLTADEIEQIIELTAKDRGAAGWDSENGWGNINADSAMRFVAHNEFFRLNATSFSRNMVWEEHKHYFVNEGSPGQSLAAGGYYVETWRLVHHFDFPEGCVFDQPPTVLIRNRGAQGWSAANPNPMFPYARVVPGTLTSTGCDVETYAYYVKHNLLGQSINKWYPCNGSSCGSNPDVLFQITLAGAPDCDPDSDGVAGTDDNCISVYNPNQEDADLDGIGDSCDVCTDTDGDGFGDPGFPANTCEVDKCPSVYSTSNLDADNDGVGDACDLCPGYDDTINSDTDSIPDCLDNCPDTYNPDQSDVDHNGIGDACDCSRPWEMTTGGLEFDEISDVQATSDSEIVITGTRTVAGVPLAYIAKYGPCQELRWETYYGSAEGGAKGQAITPVPAFGYFVGGWTANELGPLPHHQLMLWLSDSGVVTRSSNFEDDSTFLYGYDVGNGATLYCERAVTISDSIYSAIFVDSMSINGNSYATAIFRNTDSGYNEHWFDFSFWPNVVKGRPGIAPHYHEDQNYGHGYLLLCTDDSGAVPIRGNDLYVRRMDSLKIEEDLAPYWHGWFGGTGEEIGADIIMLPDSNYLLIGSTDSYGAGMKDFYAVKIDLNKNVLWERTYGKFYDEIPYAAVALSDTTVAIIGKTNSFRTDSSEYHNYIVYLDPSNGDLLADTLFGEAGRCGLKGIAATPGEIAVIAGYVEDTTGNRDMYLASIPRVLSVTVDTSCCVGMRGNVDCSIDNQVSLGDLTALQDILFNGAPICCEEETDIDGDTHVSLGDLTALIDYLFISFTPLPSCR